MVVSDPQELLAILVEQFGTLAQSRVGTEPELQELDHKVADLLSESYKNKEMLLDTPFCAEEVAAAVRKLK